MKKIIINLGFSILVFVFCIISVEVFFHFNTGYNILEPKIYNPTESSSESLIGSLEAPPAVIEKMTKLFETYELANISIRHKLALNSYKNERSIVPKSVYNFIKDEKSFVAPYIIEDRVFNKIEQVEVFNAKYKFDKNRIRITEGQKLNALKKNILLIGCSITFGTGVNQGKDMASQLVSHFPQYNIYNLGFPSGGMSDFLDEAKNPKRLKDLNTKGGAVVYTMIYDHLERTFCSIDCYSKNRQWIMSKNDYDFDSQGQLVNYGPLSKSRPFKNWAYSWLEKSEFLKFIGFERPKIYSNAEINKYIEFIKYLQAHYQKNNLDFFVYLGTSQNMFSKDIILRLNDQGVKAFAYREASSNGQSTFLSKLTIAGDGHLSEFGNEYHAALVADYLKNQGY